MTLEERVTDLDGLRPRETDAQERARRRRIDAEVKRAVEASADEEREEGLTDST